MRNLLLLLFLLAMAHLLPAQSGFDYTSKAYRPKEDPFGLASVGAYALSTQKYKDKYGVSPASALAMLQLGDNYRLNGMPVEAALWYSRGIHQARHADDHLHLAQMLRVIGQCEEANRHYHDYLKACGRPLQDLCSRPDVGELQVQVAFEHLPHINSPASDFAAIPWGEKLLFTSDRSFTRPGATLDPWTMRNFASLFQAERDASGKWRSIRRVRELDAGFHIGASALDPGGSLLFFTRTNTTGRNARSMRDLQLHYALRSGNTWKEMGPLPFNSPEFGSCHPALSADGRTLIFASDRPGGYGGMDLYRVDRQGEQWGLPVNLGPEINSAGNELFPAVSADGFLFYASDGLPGFGGMDVFVASPESEGFWKTGRNLGDAVNSTYDDFGLVPLPGRRSGYMSSNRPGGLGLDDIYAWTSDKPLGERALARAELLVVDDETGMPIPDARIRFGKQMLTTNSAGRVQVQSPVFGQQNVQAEAEGFLPAARAVDLPSKDPHLIRLSPAVFQACLFSGRDLATRAPLPQASIEVFEFLPGGQLIPVNKAQARARLQTSAAAEADVQEDPDAPWVLDARKRYQVRVKSEGYQSAVVEMMAPELVGMGPLHRKIVDLEPLILGIREEDLTEGASFRLDGIYYDYNKANIRLDARGNLDELARLMIKFPQMMIELSSHTDSRGNDFYNLDLSQRRADAAIEYLEQLGIASDRMVARGYGERRPVNHCKDGIPCSEEEYQLNRRTEFRIIRM